MRHVEHLIEQVGKGAMRFAGASLWSLLFFLLSAYVTLSESTPFLARAIAAAGSGAFLSFFLALLIEERGSALPFPARQSFSLLPALLYFYYSSLAGEDRVYAAVGMAASALALSAGLLCRRYGAAAFPRLFTGALQAAGLALLLGLSLGICLFAVDSLLLPVRGAWYAVVLEFSFFIGGFQFFLAWIPGEAGPVPGALMKVLRRILFPVYLVLLAILYGYLGKIGITGTLPSGEINWFASLAVLGYAAFYFLDPEPEEKVLRWWSRYGSLVLLPVTAVQLYCVYLRLSAYGLTVPRYASLACTFFGIFVMISGLCRRGRLLLFPLAALILFAVTVAPFPLRQVPIRDQEMRAQQVMEAAGMMREGGIVEGRPLTEAERERLLSAYRYLRSHDDGEVYTFASQIARSPVLEALSEAEYGRSSRYMYRELAADAAISIAGYTRLIRFKESTEDGWLRIHGAEAFHWEGDAQAYLAGLFEDEPGKNKILKDAMAWQADPSHQVVFQRVERMQNEGRPLRYDMEGFLLVKEP